MLKDVYVHSSWESFISNKSINQILNSIKDNIDFKKSTPSKENVFRFLSTDLENVKVIIWGRDPYPQLNEEGKRIATGRSFEVYGVTSWESKQINSSLKNILKLLHKTYFSLEKSLTIKEVRNSIKNGEFPILPPDKLFDYWEEQGVICLNRSLTCPIGKQKNASGMHEAYWTPFFEELLKFIGTNYPNIKHFLWGRAREFAPKLIKYGCDPNYLYQSNHPSAFEGDKGGYKKNVSFLNNPCFLETKNEIQWI